MRYSPGKQNIRSASPCFEGRKQHQSTSLCPGIRIQHLALLFWDPPDLILTEENVAQANQQTLNSKSWEQETDSLKKKHHTEPKSMSLLWNRSATVLSKPKLGQRSACLCKDHHGSHQTQASTTMTTSVLNPSSRNVSWRHIYLTLTVPVATIDALGHFETG